MKARRAVQLLGILVLGGCSLRGPEFALTSQLAYNEAVQQGEQRELLLNLVRMRYRENPVFLRLNSIASQLHVDARAGVSLAVGEDRDQTTQLVSPNAVIGYSESPTVTFSPQNSDDFTRRLVSGVDLESIYLLTRYGWSLERTLRLVVEELNDFRNSSTREAITASEVESINRFAQLAALMQSLYSQHLISIERAERWEQLSAISAPQVSPQDVLNAASNGYRFAYSRDAGSYVLEGRGQYYALRIADRDTPETRMLREWLGLAPGDTVYEIQPGDPIVSAQSSLRIRTRSVLGVMAYLSHSVAVPQSDIEGGFVDPSPLEILASNPLFRVRSAPVAPTEAFIAVSHRGRWFYIEGGDLESRRTFGVLSSLIRLEIGVGDSQNSPILTLPVAR